MGSILLLVLLPFGEGLEARVGQGPMSDGSHRGVWAWDFLLDEGEPAVAAASGRVIRVIDDRTATGENRFELANQIFIDHGAGIFSTYVHHQARTARVREGEIVTRGRRIASVGRTGTIVPHIHFDVRGPSWEESHPVRFRTASGDVQAVQGAVYSAGWSKVPAQRASPEETASARRNVRPGPGGQKYSTSATRGVDGPFADSEIRGSEFEAAGVRLDPGGFAFRITARVPRVFRGRATRATKSVGFWLWSDSTTTQYSTSATVDEEGRFALIVQIPPELRGGRWYRIGPIDPSPERPETRTLPVLVE